MWRAAGFIVGVWIVSGFGIGALWVGFVLVADWYYRVRAIRRFRRQLERI